MTLESSKRKYGNTTVKSTRGGSFSNMNLSTARRRAFANGRYHQPAVFYAKQSRRM